LAARHVGGQFEDDLNQQLLPSATTIDVAAGLPLTRRLALSFRAENLLDRQVAATISSSGVVERATPRTLWLGLSLRP
jgi:outer membrane receptor protein involved in Fe transport